MSASGPSDPLVCIMIFFYPQSYYFSQLLTIDHDCPAPVDKLAVSKHFPHPFDSSFILLQAKLANPFHSIVVV